MVNDHCFKYEEINYKKGIFDNFIDTTYIITMIDSSRYNNYKTQLDKYQPTKKLFILYNYGYKFCNKILKENIPPHDLIDAYFNILHHAKKNNFNNILILEDDFIFNPKINDKSIINDINSFFNKNIDKEICFNLGTIPILLYPNINIYDNIYKSPYCYTSHGILYNKNIQNDIINKQNLFQDKNKHWDILLTTNYNIYFYKEPLCYQTFPETDNQKYWTNNLSGYITYNIIKILELDKKIQPGYKILYNSLFFINYSIYILLLIIFLYIIYKSKMYIKLY